MQKNYTSTNKTIQKTAMINKYAVSLKTMNKHLINCLQQLYANYTALDDEAFKDPDSLFGSRKNIVDDTKVSGAQRFNELADLYLEIKAYVIQRYADDAQNGLNFFRHIKNIDKLESGLKDRGKDVTCSDLLNAVPIDSLFENGTVNPKCVIACYGNGHDAWHIYATEYLGAYYMFVVDVVNNRKLYVTEVTNPQEDFNTCEALVMSHFQNFENYLNGDGVTPRYERVLGDQYDNPYNIDFNTETWNDYQQLMDMEENSENIEDDNIENETVEDAEENAFMPNEAAQYIVNSPDASYDLLITLEPDNEHIRATLYTGNDLPLSSLAFNTGQEAFEWAEQSLLEMFANSDSTIQRITNDEAAQTFDVNFDTDAWKEYEAQQNENNNEENNSENEEENTEENSNENNENTEEELKGEVGKNYAVASYIDQNNLVRTIVIRRRNNAEKPYRVDIYQGDFETGSETEEISEGADMFSSPQKGFEWAEKTILNYHFFHFTTRNINENECNELGINTNTSAWSNYDPNSSNENESGTNESGTNESNNESNSGDSSSNPDNPDDNADDNPNNADDTDDTDDNQPEGKKYQCTLEIQMTYTYIEYLNELMARCVEAQKKGQVIEYSFLRKQKHGRLMKRLTYGNTRFGLKPCKTVLAIESKTIFDTIKPAIELINDTPILVAKYYSSSPEPADPDVAGSHPIPPDDDTCCAIVIKYDNDNSYLAVLESSLTELKPFVELCQRVFPEQTTPKPKFLYDDKSKELLNTFKEMSDAGSASEYNRIYADLISLNVKGIYYSGNFRDADAYIRNNTHTQYVDYDASVEESMKNHPDDKPKINETIVALEITFRYKFAYTIERFLVDHKKYVVNYDSVWKTLHDYMTQYQTKVIGK